MRKYFTTWWIFTIKASQIAFVSRLGAVTFTTGKLLRFGLFLLFLIVLQSQTKAIAGYTIWQVILFFATFNLVDTLSQFLLREVYRFRWYVVSGNFDFILLKPISALFRSLFGGSDILDIPMVFLSLVLIIYAGMNVGNVTFSSILLFFILIINAFIITLSFHIFVLAIGVLTTEIDNTIMLYRDVTQMGRFPIDIYKEPLRSVLTFAIPVGIMMTFPAKVLMGLLSFEGILVSFLISSLFLILSLWFWRYGLKNYSSASS